MTTPMRAALTWGAPIAFVSVDTMLIVAAVLAGGGAVLIGLMAFRAGRRRAPPEAPAVRRAPSPSSLGLADDPIVAAIAVAADESRRPRRPREVDRTEP